MGQAPRHQPLYEADFYSWTHRQAKLLRAGRLRELDVANIAEELETLGRSEAAALQSSLRLIAMHLLKMIHQPERITDSWRNTIARERVNAEQTLDDNPGLHPRSEELFLKAYRQARKLAAVETKMPIAAFPIDPEFGLDQALDEGFLPNDAQA